MTNLLCKCEKAGFCTRHKIEKDKLLYQACRGESDHVDCGRKFWHAWEQGNLGATIPEDPQPDIEWECNHKILKSTTFGTERKASVQTKTPERVPWPTTCAVGRRIKLILKEEFNITATGSCPCNRHAAEMDNWGCDKCEKKIKTIVGWLMSSSWRRPIQNLKQVIKGRKVLKSAKTALNMKEELTTIVRRAIEIERERVKEIAIL